MATDDFDRDWDAYPPRGPMEHVIKVAQKIFVHPVIWVRKNIVEPNQKKYPYYHKPIRRVPTIDQCYEDDEICKYEAGIQFQRDKRIDSLILSLLRDRYEDCVLWEGYESNERCKPLWDIFTVESGHWAAKYMDIGGNPMNAYMALMKQKHRLVWERRHGPVGTGMKQKKYRNDGSVYWE